MVDSSDEKSIRREQITRRQECRAGEAYGKVRGKPEGGAADQAASRMNAQYLISLFGSVYPTELPCSRSDIVMLNFTHSQVPFSGREEKTQKSAQVDFDISRIVIMKAL